MTRYTRKITKEQYERAIKNGGILTKEDQDIVFTSSERCGYGVELMGVVDNYGQYYVTFKLGNPYSTVNKDVI